MNDLFYVAKDRDEIIKKGFYVEFTKKQQKDVWSFACKLKDKKGQSVDYYTENRGTKPGKALEDAYVGKLAEWAASFILHDKFDFPKVKPDMKIYEKKRKSWEEDLIYPDPYPNFHVKGTDGKWGATWVTQYSSESNWNTGMDKNLFGEDIIEDFDKDEFFFTRTGKVVEGHNSHMCCCVVDDPHGENCRGYVYAIFPWRVIIENGVLGEMKFPKYRHMKLPIYHSNEDKPTAKGKSLLELSEMYAV